MILSNLGSILEKLCDSCACSCAFGSFFNCSRNYVVVIGGNNTEEEKAILDISRKNQDLLDAINTVYQNHQQTLPFLNIPTKSVPSLKAKKYDASKARAAVLQSCLHCLKIIEECSGNISEEECKIRLNTTIYLAGIEDLNDLYFESTPIKQVELDKLEVFATDMKKYGSAAVFLWKTLKDKDFLKNIHFTPLPKEHEIILKRIVGLEKKINNKKNKRCLHKKEFNKIKLEHQKLFFKAAHGFSDHLIEKIGFMPWIEISQGFEFGNSSSQKDDSEATSSEACRHLHIHQPGHVEFHNSVAYLQTHGSVTISNPSSITIQPESESSAATEETNK